MLISHSEILIDRSEALRMYLMVSPMPLLLISTTYEIHFFSPVIRIIDICGTTEQIFPRYKYRICIYLLYLFIYDL